MTELRATPELTSAERLEDYPPGQKILTGAGPAWRDVQMSVFSLTAQAEEFQMPAVSEPFIAWIAGGEARTEERETGGAWVSSHVKPGSLFVTMAGAPYEFRWQRLSAEPLEIVLLLLGVPMFDAALRDLYGDKAPDAHFRNSSGIVDEQLQALLQSLRGELLVPAASALFVQSMAHAIAVHLVRHYTDFGVSPLTDANGLAPHKLRLITEWMADHLAQPFSLAALADMAAMSEFHFNRLFKRAVGLPPSQYQIQLRIAAARQQLRETKASIVTIANEVGYSNPSHFAQVFRKETGLSPSDYRRRRP